jgi:hypothetical protein
VHYQKEQKTQKCKKAGYEPVFTKDHPSIDHGRQLAVVAVVASKKEGYEPVFTNGLPPPPWPTSRLLMMRLSSSPPERATKSLVYPKGGKYSSRCFHRFRRASKLAISK